MNVLWLPEAMDDLERCFEFLLDKDPVAAMNAVETIQQGAARLIEHPEIGRPMQGETGRRELFMPFGAGAYVLRYRLLKDSVVIIRLWHCREQR